jgi:hypothetical protein
MKFARLAVLSLILAAATSSASAVEKGFVPLFDGKTLQGWIGAVDGYAVHDGAIVCEQKKGGGNLLTEKEYSDFILRFDVLIPTGGNNGIALRAPNATGSLAYVGTEVQILDDDDEQYKTIKPYQFHGSVYGIVAAKTGARKPDGQWNSMEITMQGRRIRVVVNNKIVVDADLDQATKNGTVDGKEHPGLARSSGHIGFLGHGHPVAFRNLRIKELGPDDSAFATSGRSGGRRTSILRSLLNRLR